METYKQEMKLIHPLPGLWSKNFFSKMFLISFEASLISKNLRRADWLTDSQTSGKFHPPIFSWLFIMLDYISFYWFHYIENGEA